MAFGGFLKKTDMGSRHIHKADRCLYSTGKARKVRQRKWRKYKQLRERWLRDNPLCVRCREEGLTVAAEQVDHIKPISMGENEAEIERLLMDDKNLQSLCIDCHKIKTLGEDARLFRGMSVQRLRSKWRNKAFELL